jgi:hypothetical protein
MMRLLFTVFIMYLTYPLYGQQVKGLVNNAKTDTMLVLPKDSGTDLKEVAVKGIRNYQQFNLNTRKEFASVFNYKAPTLKDIFIKKSPYTSASYSAFQSSTSSIASINVLSLIGLLNKNHSAETRLQKKLLREEGNNYVDQVFSVGKVRSLTSLQGDSLQLFMTKYAPSTAQAKQMNDYQILLYIKKSYVDFMKDDQDIKIPGDIK